MVSKDELIQSVWQGSFVTDHVLSHAVWQLRQALRDPKAIEAIPKRGYRLVLEISLAGKPTQTDPIPASRDRLSAIVVLPLANLMGDPSQEYFVDGMADALTLRLAQIPALHVISRASGHVL